MSSASKLFQPIRVGAMELKHRIVMNPMTRYRASEEHVPSDLTYKFYDQRASTPGTLLITEATFIGNKASGQRRAPGIFSDEQIFAWKKITDRVHKNGSFIFLQLWALGRAAYPDVITGKGFDYVAASAIPLKDRDTTPRALTVDEIQDYVTLFGVAAHNAVKRAGFDGVEIHGANGYLVDQFLQTNTNTRTDQYGGSVENRIRFADEVIDSVVAAVGAEHAAIRLSPWGVFQEMGMPDPVPTFSALVERIREKHPNLAYLHVVEPDEYGVAITAPGIERTNKFIDDLWLPRPIVHAANYTRETAIAEADSGEGKLVGFGRSFIANPDLPVRFLKQLPLANPDYSKLYTHEADGYIDYPFAAPEASETTASL